MSYLKEDEIQTNILNYLSKQEWPSTTGDVARGVKISWNTAQIHLIKLQMKGKVKFRRVGRQNQWWLSENYNKENF